MIEERDEAGVAEGDGLTAREAAARVHEHGVARGNATDRAVEIGLGVLHAADDDDMEPEARKPAT